ncbi:MAG: NYN domain-containing protein [Nanoarchaeota archaeon]
MLEKSIVLIDAENVIKNWRVYCVERGLDYKIDYKKLIQVLTKHTNLLRAYFYDGVSENILAKKKNFLEALQKAGIQLRTKALKKKRMVCEHCGHQTIKEVQKGVDVSLATDILRHGFQRTCDICIIVSGDEDYKDAIDLVKDIGIKVWVVSLRNALSSELEKTADKIFFIDDFVDQIKFNHPESLQK